MKKREYPGSIKNWPKDDRPREKILASGAETLSDSELIAVLLNTGIRGKSAIDLAREIIQIAGGINRLPGLTINSLKRRGVGAAKLARILAAVELGRRIASRCATRNIQNLKICSPQDVLTYLNARLAHLPRESLVVLLLNTRNYILREVLISQGTVDRALIDPADVVREALRDYANAVILVHNHPGGEPDPSAEDIELTGKVIQAAKIFGIRVLDHIIISRQRHFSFYDAGLIAK